MFGSIPQRCYVEYTTRQCSLIFTCHCIYCKQMKYAAASDFVWQSDLFYSIFFIFIFFTILE